MALKILSETRGFRNNNPGNIEKSDAFAWNGEIEFLQGIPEETRFCQFCNLDFGIRAIYRLLKTYREKHGIDNIEGIISRFAPSDENDTKSYVSSVLKTIENRYLTSKSYDFTAEGSIDKSCYPALVESIIMHENGFSPITFKYLKSVFVWAVPEWN